jgi:hypothetical protein
MTAGSLLLILAAAVSQVETRVTVSPLSGPAVSGTLQQLTVDAIAIQGADAAPLRWSRRELRRVDFDGENNPGGRAPQIIVELADGSRLMSSEFVTGNRRATVTTAGATLELPTSGVSSVLLQDIGNNDSLRQQWQALLDQPHTTDVLVFPREVEGTVRLDTLEGIVHDVGGETVDFTFNDQRSTPRRSRVFGLIFFRAPGDTAPARAETVCRLTDRTGSLWNLSGYELREDRLEWTTAAGIRSAAPVAALQSLDFAAGNLLYLSDLAFESADWQPYVESRLDKKLLAESYAPRRDQAFDGGPLRLGGQTFTKGLALRSRSEVTFRLTAEFQHFRALVGIDDRIREAGISATARLVVRGDDRTLYDGKLGTAEAPLELDLEVGGVRRLRILVDYSEDLDIGDHLNFCDARLTK